MRNAFFAARFGTIKIKNGFWSSMNVRNYSILVAGNDSPARPAAKGWVGFAETAYKVVGVNFERVTISH